MVKTNISPGVYTTLTDLSDYVRKVPTSIGFIPIVCKKGRDNELIATNARDFFLEFGEPDLYYPAANPEAYRYGHYVASSFLTESDSLFVIRCTAEDASFANLMWDSTTFSYYSVVDVTTTKKIETELQRDDDSFMIYAVGRGEYYNNFKLKVEAFANTGADSTYNSDLYIISIYKKLNESLTDLNVDVISDSTGLDKSLVTQVNEEYAITESFKVSFKRDRLDYSGSSLWIEDVINNNSRYFRCKVNSTFDFSNLVNADKLQTLDGSVTTSIVFGSGSDGTPDYTKLLSKAYLGLLKKNVDDGSHVLDEVLNTDDFYFSMVFDAGYPQEVKYAIESLVSRRKDCLGIIDNGDNYTATAAVAQKIGYGFNNKYLAIYEPYTKVYDAFTGRYIWVPPSYHLAKLFPALKKEWLGPAGFEHGIVTGIKESRYNPSPSQRDDMYLNQINPIVRFNEGYAVYSQLTTQARTTALQDVNIMRVYLYIKRALEQFCKWYVFSLNDEETWSRINQKVSAFLAQIKNGGGLYSYSVTVGADDYQKKSKEVHVNVTLEPVRLAEKIYLNFFIK